MGFDSGKKKLEPQYFIKTYIFHIDIYIYLWVCDSTCYLDKIILNIPGLELAEVF